MPLFLQHSDENARWGVWKIEETPLALEETLTLEEAPPAELARLKTDARRQEWLAARVLLRVLAGGGKRILYEPSGKPFLADGAFSISISHTKGYAAVLLKAPGEAAGIDIERYSRRVHRVASKFMNEAERLTPFQGDHTWPLLLHWSAKETVYKCVGQDCVDLRKTIRITPFVPAPEGVVEAVATPEGAGAAWGKPFHIYYRLFPEFVLTMNK